MTDDLRTPLGPGVPRPEVLGTPTWDPAPADAECPNCRARLCHVAVEVRAPRQLRTSGRAVCRYLGCPACAYAGPAMITAM